MGSTASLTIQAMSGLLGKLAGQLTTGSGSGSASGSGGSNAQSSGPGKILHTLTDKATGQTHPQDSAGSSQNSYLPGGGGRYFPESHPQQQYGREHRADEYQQGLAGWRRSLFPRVASSAAVWARASRRRVSAGPCRVAAVAISPSRILSSSMGASIAQTSISRAMPGMARATTVDTSSREAIRHLEVTCSLGNSGVNSL